MKIVLDTHIIIHAAANSLAPGRVQLLQKKDTELLFSSISLWEITKLHQLGRFSVEDGLEVFLRKIATHKRYLEVGLSVEVLVAVAEIASKMHKDPADQIIVATALTNGAHLMTDDKLIRKSGVVKVV
jgi:PIN domain nuclease of toxin-antitoxin system